MVSIGVERPKDFDVERAPARPGISFAEGTQARILESAPRSRLAVIARRMSNAWSIRSQTPPADNVAN